MERLSEEMLSTIEHVTKGGLGATAHSTRLMVAEIRDHRCAIVADKKQVWAVVNDEAESVLGSDIHVLVGNMDSERIANAIATRVADRLATPAPKLTEEERNHLLSIRSHLSERRGHHSSVNLWSDELATLDRLLGDR